MLDGSIYYGGENTEFRGLKQDAVAAHIPAATANAFEGQTFRIGITMNLGTGSF